MRVLMQQRDGKWFSVLSGRRPERRVELRDGLWAEFFDRRERCTKQLGQTK